MELDIKETHDRYKEFTKKDQDIGECCADLIKQRPFGNHAFYIFVHGRTDDDGVTKRLIWQPRLTRPKPQTNSMLFKGYPGSDEIKVIWMIPARELWGQYEKGLVTEQWMIKDSIHAFNYDRPSLERNEDDDLPDWRVDQIYKEISQQANQEKTKRVIEEALKASD